MLFFIVTFLSTFFAIYHLINSIKFKSESEKYKIFQKGFSILIPCYNEAGIIKNTINGLDLIDYNNYEVIFINDGSTDDTIDILDEELQLIEIEDGFFQSRFSENIFVIDKANGGKADSLNAGIKKSNKELVCTLDADCILHKDSLSYMNHVFKDNDVIAAGGVVKVLQMFRLNKKLKLLVKLQTLEFLKGFYVYKVSLAFNNALSIISGAFGVFRKEELEIVGSFKSGLGEDIDITLRMQDYAIKNNKKVTYDLNAICYTECPESFKDLTKQRIRWQKAFVDAIIKNRKFLFKSVLTKGLAFHVIIDSMISAGLSTTLLVVNAVFSIFLGLGHMSIELIYYYFITIVFHIIYSFYAVLKERKSYEKSIKKNVLGIILIDILFFRFINALYYIFGSILYFFNSDDWNKVERTNHNYNVLIKEVGEA